jgi:predicted transcriptional regulator
MKEGIDDVLSEKILQNVTNRRILILLKQHSRLYTGDIIRKLSLSPSRGVNHINQLKEAGLIKTCQDTARLTLVEDGYSRAKAIVREMD